MTNFLLKKSNLLLALALLGTPALEACSTADSNARAGEAGDLSLRLKVGDRDIDTVHYEISRPGSSSIVGDLNVTSAKTLSFRIGGLPAGTGYTIALTATTRDGEQSCSGSASFDVVAGRVTSVAITLSCSDVNGTSGSIDVNGNFNQCPVITSLVASPLEVAVGESITLNATATDADGHEVTFGWNDEDGSFATVASASYVCESAGEHQLTLNVTDGKCVATDTVVVVCSDDGTGTGTGSDSASSTGSDTESGSTTSGTDSESTATTSTSGTESTSTSGTESTSTSDTGSTSTSTSETESGDSSSSQNTESSSSTDDTDTETTSTTGSDTETSTEETSETETSGTTSTETDSTETDSTETDSDSTFESESAVDSGESSDSTVDTLPCH